MGVTKRTKNGFKFAIDTNDSGFPQTPHVWFESADDKGETLHYDASYNALRDLVMWLPIARFWLEIDSLEYSIRRNCLMTIRDGRITRFEWLEE